MIVTEKSNGICPQCGKAIIVPAIINIIDSMPDGQSKTDIAGRKKEFCTPQCGGDYQRARQPSWTEADKAKIKAK